MIDSKLVGKVNIPELVKALRCNQTKEECAKCQYSTGLTCKQIKLDMDAAAAIEALQAEVKRLDSCRKRITENMNILARACDKEEE